jgi:streptogramin lyase/mono/diheme cytochrome c family protein
MDPFRTVEAIRRGIAVRAWLGVIALAFGVIAVTGSVAVGSSGSDAALPTVSPVTRIPGMATLSGSVESTAPFTAARVRIRNVDKRILYMVYTNAGRYRAVALFPGNYEISVTADGLESDVQRLVVAADENATLNLSLRPSASTPDRTELSYEEIYPAGPGRDVAERTCMICHGENWLSSRPGSAEVWEARLDRMMGTALSERPAASYAEGLLTHRNQALRFSLEDREALLAYMVANFGPDAEPRFVRIDDEIPLDEEKLGKAMYMEYYLPPDPPGQGSNAPEFNSRRRGQDPRFDHDGNVWLVDRGFPHRLVKLDPRTGEQKDYVLPDPVNGHHEVLIDPTGMIWLPEHVGRQPSTEKRLLGFNPRTETFEYLIPMDPDNVVRNEIKWLQSLAMDSKNNLYVGWIMGGALSKYERATGKVSVFPLPNINAIVYGVVADSRDNIFMADWGSGNIVKFDTETNGWTIFTSPTYPGQVRRLNVDTQDNVWWGIYSAGRRPGMIAKLDQRTGKITEYPIPRQNTQPYDISQAPDGTFWSPDAGGSGAALLNFDPRTEEFAIYPTPQPGADMPKVQITRDGAIWYSPRGSNDAPGLGVLYPDMDQITSLAAYYVNGPPGYPFSTGNSLQSRGQ